MGNKFDYIYKLNFIEENDKSWLKKTELEKMFGKVKVRLNENEYMVSDTHGILIDIDSHYKYIMMSKTELGYAFRDWLSRHIFPKLAKVFYTTPFSECAMEQEEWNGGKDE